MSLDGRAIALIEDDAVMGESLAQWLSLEGASVDWWKDGTSALEGLRSASPDLVVCDMRLPDISGEQIFNEVTRRPGAPPFLFMTAFADIDEAVRLMRSGAGDYITKPFEVESLMDRSRGLMRSRVATSSPGLLGASPAMRQIETALRKISNLPQPVLLLGETGVGKEVCARFLHSNSTRAKAPLVAVNCAALPPELMESELFGHEKGAFTGASALHRGYAERAEDGVLFLDEITELPIALQAKLLRLLEQRTYARVGGERDLSFKARIVCAANVDPLGAVKAGRFRLDLLHRINTLTIVIPPLRERRADIQLYLGHFFDSARAASGSSLKGIAPGAIEAVLEHDWPGNVRELKNRIERAVALAAGERILCSDLFPDLAVAGDAQHSERFLTLAAVRAAAERRQIERALSETAHSPGEAARLLGISRTTLWEKMRRLGIEGAGTDG
ncbi:MAG: sigma-54 dependent transcriptional regulator [Hyphomicrobiaceae bacterium]|nr:sigma-54 dependent transcriptional regulator [Hyphomicrobiaceae bacterium]